jgi:hypothetical protein
MKKSFLSQIFVLAIIFALIGNYNIFSQKQYKDGDVRNQLMTVGPGSATANMNPDAECTGPNQLIYDDGVFENGYGWINTVTDGRMVSLFTPPAYPWQFNTFCLALTKAGTAADFTFDIEVYEATCAGGEPTTLVTTITGVTAVGVPVYPSYTFYDFDISSIPQLNSGSYYIGIKWNPSVYQSYYMMADESVTTPYHPGYGYDDIDAAWFPISDFGGGGKALGYRTLGPAAGPGFATGPTPANFSTDVTITGLNLSWTNPGGETSNAVYFGTDPCSLSLLYSGTPVNNYNAPTPLAYETRYYWRVDETDGSGTTYSDLWSFKTELAPLPPPAETPFTENFDGAWPNDWVVVNGTQTNQWVVGATAVPVSSPNSIFISSDGGTTWGYDPNTISVVHFFRDITFTNSLGGGYQLTFQWKCVGEATAWDYFRVFLVETSVYPAEGIELTSGQIGDAQYNAQTDYVEASILLPENLTGTTKRLVFSWKNDGSLSNGPPASIDDISIIPVESSGINPPVGLQASVTDQDVHLTWLAPPDRTLRWDDGINVNSIGVGGGNWEVAARFPASITGTMAGKELRSVEFFVHDLPTNLTLKIYDQGTATSPGTLIYSEDITSSIGTVGYFNAFTFPAITLSGNDIWIGFEMTGGNFPAGVDAGATADGDWLTLDGGVTWAHLFGYGFDNDWNIAGFVYDAGPLGSVSKPIVLNSNSGMNTESLNIQKTDNRTQNGTSNSKILTSLTKAKYGIDYKNHLSKQKESKFKQNFGNDAIDATLTGYNVYRDAVLQAFVTVGTESYDDLALPYDTYSYTVTALYEEGESDPAGPLVVNVVNPNIITIDVYPTSAEFWTGSTEGTTKTDGQITNGEPIYGWAAFNVSAIPVGAIIVSVSFNGYVNANNYPYWSIGPMGGVNPVTETDAAVIYDAIYNGYLNSYIDNYESGTLPLGWLSRDLSGTVITDMEAALAQGWFAIGTLEFDFYASYYINFDGWSQANPPYLHIEYMNPPESPIFSIAPTSKDFGYAFSGTSSANQTFTITNVGVGTLTISTPISITGTDANQFDLTDLNGYPIELGAAESATVNVKFSPTSSGAKTASLTIVDNTGADATHNISLTGMGGATLPYAENFDGFVAGQQVACQDPINWTTWSLAPCDLVEDPYVSSNYAHSGLNSAVIVANNDLVKRLGNQTSGKWSISLWVYIPATKSGYFNTLTGFTPDTFEWGMDCYFDVGGAGRVDTTGGGGGGTNDVPFAYNVDQWNQVEVLIDLDSPTHPAEFWINGSMAATWDWTQAGTKVNRIAANDFFGAAATDEMYFDDYAFSQSGGTTFSYSIDVYPNKWNMVSAPGINPAGMGVGDWWPNYTGNVWSFNGTVYVNETPNPTTPGKGYWMKHNGTNTTYDYTDIGIVSHDPIPGHTNWNIIGVYENNVVTSGITTDPGGQRTGTVWGFNGTVYVNMSSGTLEPGYGYWIKLLSTCDIIIPEPPLAKSSGEVADYFKEDWGRITMTDAAGISYTLYAVKGEVDLDQYEMPPMPPAGSFDIRYSSGRVAEDINSSVQTIDMSGITYPLTVRVENMDIRLQDVTGKAINVNLKSGEDIVISDATINKLMVSGELIPTVYALEQNYPNPFNPSTVIEFSLPENVSNVKLSIYNVLGEKVAELVNTALDAGRYSYQWNAGNVATGMYIYELRTDKFVSVKKMMLLK